MAEISPAQADRLLDDLTAIVARAATIVSSMSPASVARRTKSDGSSVTEADEASQAEILTGLAKLVPNVPALSEENIATAAPPPRDGTFIIIDPLDGTREFLSGTDEFAVMLAIVTRGVPIAGIIAAPLRDTVWRGVVGLRAEKLRLAPTVGDQAKPIHTRRWPAADACAMISRSHLDPATENFLGKLGPVQRTQSGSGIKFGLVADGTADIYPRLGNTGEWDVAAGHAIVVAAGGALTTPDRKAINYGSAETNFIVPAFVAWGDPTKAAALDL